MLGYFRKLSIFSNLLIQVQFLKENRIFRKNFIFGGQNSVIAEKMPNVFLAKVLKFCSMVHGAVKIFVLSMWTLLDTFTFFVN